MRPSLLDEGTASAADSWRWTVECIVGDAARRGVPPEPWRIIRLVRASRTMRFQATLRLLHHVQVHHRRSVRHVVLRALHRRWMVRYGYEIPPATVIGPGLLLVHLGSIVVHQDAVLGRNVNLLTGVVIGRSNRGPRAGVPTIGDNVYVGPGAKVIGAIHVGNDVAIGANAVVTRDVADHQVVAGVPASVVSTDGAAGYLERLS